MTNELLCWKHDRHYNHSRAYFPQLWLGALVALRDPVSSFLHASISCICKSLFAKGRTRRVPLQSKAERLEPHSAAGREVHAKRGGPLSVCWGQIFLLQMLWPCSIDGSPCRRAHQWLEELEVGVNGEGGEICYKCWSSAVACFLSSNWQPWLVKIREREKRRVKLWSHCSSLGWRGKWGKVLESVSTQTFTDAHRDQTETIWLNSSTFLYCYIIFTH